MIKKLLATAMLVLNFIPFPTSYKPKTMFRENPGIERKLEMNDRSIARNNIPLTKLVLTGIMSTACSRPKFFMVLPSRFLFKQTMKFLKLGRPAEDKPEINLIDVDSTTEQLINQEFTQMESLMTSPLENPIENLRQLEGVPNNKILFQIHLNHKELIKELDRKIEEGSRVKSGKDITHLIQEAYERLIERGRDAYDTINRIQGSTQSVSLEYNAEPTEYIISKISQPHKVNGCVYIGDIDQNNQSRAIDIMIEENTDQNIQRTTSTIPNLSIRPRINRTELLE